MERSLLSLNLIYLEMLVTLILGISLCLHFLCENCLRQFYINVRDFEYHTF